jgi:hypothetical protein
VILLENSNECDEDITNIDTPTVVAYNSKVRLFFSIIIIFNICDPEHRLTPPINTTVLPLGRKCEESEV